MNLDFQNLFCDHLRQNSMLYCIAFMIISIIHKFRGIEVKILMAQNVEKMLFLIIILFYCFPHFRAVISSYLYPL